ncbi:MAG: hypothetical protein ACNA8W_02910 [Bradymonadaceae bacterium]
MFVLLIAMAILPGCSFGCNSEVLAEDFFQICDYDEECRLVTEGDACECHVCPNAAIHEADMAAFQKAWDRATCSPEPECPAIGCGEDYVAHCSTEDLCAIRQAIHTNTDGFNTSCTVDDDCASVFAGEVCDPCQCHNASINIDAVGVYENARQGAKHDLMCRSFVLCDCPGVQLRRGSGTCQARAL